MRNIWRGAIGLLVVCFILFSGMTAMAANVTQEQVNAAVIGGQNYLKAQQQPGGYWESYGYRVAETAAAVAALLETGVPRTDQHVIDGINYLKTQVQGNGGIYSYSEIYETGLALVAIGLYNDPGAQLKTIAQNAMNFLLTGQNRSNPAAWYYGGWRYSAPAPNDADLSVTQFAVMGLYYGSQYLGLSIPGSVWAGPLKSFLQACAVPGGGFTYIPGYGNYYSMTGAGFWCAAMAGIEADSAIAPLLNSAKAWFNTNYTWDVNDYYLFAMAKGLAAAVGTNTLIGEHNWVQDLKNWLVDPDNGNIQTVGGRDTQNYWSMGYYPIFSTSWAIMSLGFADPNTPSPTKRIADDLDNPIKGTVTLHTENGVLISGAIRQPIANANLGITVKLPIGAMSFKLLNMTPGGSTVLRIDLPLDALDPDNPDSFVNPDGTFNPANIHWFKIQAGAWKSNAAIPIVLVYNNPADWTQGGYLEVTLTDNGPGDEDPTLGTYEDPGAPGMGGAEPDNPTETDRASGSGGAGCFITTVGTPSAGGFMALALVFLLGLAVFIRRR